MCGIHYIFIYLCCLSVNHQGRSLSACYPGQRPGMRGSGHPECQLWPACRPSVQSSHQENISLLAPRTYPESPRHPIHPERSCNPARGTLLKEKNIHIENEICCRICYKNENREFLCLHLNKNVPLNSLK